MYDMYVYLYIYLYIYIIYIYIYVYIGNMAENVYSVTMTMF